MLVDDALRAGPKGMCICRSRRPFPEFPMRHLSLCALVLMLAVGALPAQNTISVPDGDASAGTCNAIPFGSGTSPTWTPQTYVGRIQAAFLDPANPYFDEISFAPCGSGTLTATSFQVALGHIPAAQGATMNFPNVTTLALGDFLDLTVAYDSDVSGGLNWTVTGNTWNPLGYSGTGGTGFTWNGVDDVGVYITQNGMNAPLSAFHRAGGTEPYRWYDFGSPAAYQAPASSGGGLNGLKIQIDCTPGAAGPFTLTTNNTPSTGDLHLGLANIPGTALEGWTLISTNVSGPVGQGAWGGLYPDPLTITIINLTLVASPGSPLHWTWPVTSPLWPADSANFPPGSFPAPLYGTSWDFMALVSDGTPFSISNAQRVNW